MYGYLSPLSGLVCHFSMWTYAFLFRSLMVDGDGSPQGFGDIFCPLRRYPGKVHFNQSFLHTVPAATVSFNNGCFKRYALQNWHPQILILQCRLFLCAKLIVRYRPLSTHSAMKKSVKWFNILISVTLYLQKARRYFWGIRIIISPARLKTSPLVPGIFANKT